ncbi:MAG: 2-C-methyl-D-erythritol 2,4-cyclodiphosphate synthase [Candidatus Binatia bacterium]|nr:2-C-methyl-D-erythritol 2,4-cyclodiphosphate synthase [Candidatus Binatia bacterium]
MIRVGHGYDLHKLVPGRALYLGGVALEYDRGLLGHSDGDVVLHALCDALLGAMALGDIGQLFPDTDERFLGTPSSVLVKEVARLVQQEGWEVFNVDVTIVAEAPRLAPHRHAMRSRIAELLGIPIEAVSVKAKSNEGVDAIGRGEAIAATVVAALREQPQQQVR